MTIERGWVYHLCRHCRTTCNCGAVTVESCNMCNQCRDDEEDDN